MPSVLSLHRSVLKSRHQAVKRHKAGRWHPNHAIVQLPRVASGTYLTEADCHHAVARMNRAVRRMRRLGRDASEIPTHVKQNAGTAHAQLAR